MTSKGGLKLGQSNMGTAAKNFALDPRLAVNCEAMPGFIIMAGRRKRARF